MPNEIDLDAADVQGPPAKKSRVELSTKTNMTLPRSLGTSAMTKIMSKSRRRSEKHPQSFGAKEMVQVLEVVHPAAIAHGEM